MHSRRAFLASGIAAALARAAEEPSALTLTDASALIGQRKLTPLELVDSCLRRVERFNPTLNAFITTLGDQARAKAGALRPADRPKQPLHGIPIALKDLYDTAGARTTAGSAQWRDRVPTRSAEVVRRLEEAGAIVIGKANLDEFAYNFTSETSAFGAAHNPWKVGYTPGGSSGGSAIAVASGMALAAMGSDTGGSIRLPAAFCGITGYKPTYGRVPLEGVAPLSWSLDHAGPMTRTALDAARMLRALTGNMVPVSAATPFRFGLVSPLFNEGLELAVERAMREAAAVFRRIGREVREVRIPPLTLNPGTPLPAGYTTIIYAEAYTYHREMLARNPNSFHPGTRSTIELGKDVDAATYILARRQMEEDRARAAETLFQDADLLLTPTAPRVAFPLGTTPDLICLRNTAPWNYYGLPTISIPCGFGEHGLPIGLQITGKPGADTAVLSAAAAFQLQTDFHTRQPSL